MLGQLDGARQRDQVPAWDHLHVPAQSRPSDPALEVNGEEPILGPDQDAGGDVRPPVDGQGLPKDDVSLGPAMRPPSASASAGTSCRKYSSAVKSGA
jgi:hypothetical protein